MSGFNEYYNSHYSIIGDYSHGTLENALHHKKMMEDIANEVVRQAKEDYDRQLSQKIEEIAKQAYREAIEDFLQALEYDVESVVTIGLNGCEEIFRDKKTQRIISDHIMQEVRRRLDKLKIKI